MRGKSCAFAMLLAAGAVFAQPASAQTPTVDQLPAALKPAGMAVYLEVPATGVQIYTCGKNNAGAWAWKLKGPEAELFDTQKKSIGKHYGGPTWEGAGGKVVGAVKANAPAPGGNTIPVAAPRHQVERGLGPRSTRPRASCGCRPSAEPLPPRAATKRTPTRKAASPTRRPTCS